MNLPVEVVQAARDRRCTLFSGVRASLEAAQDADLELADQKDLARRLGGKGSVRALCAAYEAARGREALERVVHEATSPVGLAPGAFHRLAAQRFDRVLTSAQDDLFERAAAEVGRPVAVAYRGDELGEPDPGRLVVYKLRGGFERPGSLVLTEADQLAHPLTALTRQVRRLFTRDVAFFVGYRPDEEEFDHVFDDLSGAFGGELPRCHLAVAQGRISDYHWQKWVWRGLLLFTADPLEALEELERQAHA